MDKVRLGGFKVSAWL